MVNIVNKRRGKKIAWLWAASGVQRKTPLGGMGAAAKSRTGAGGASRRIVRLARSSSGTMCGRRLGFSGSGGQVADGELAERRGGLDAEVSRQSSGSQIPDGVDGASRCGGRAQARSCSGGKFQTSRSRRQNVLSTTISTPTFFLCFSSLRRVVRPEVLYYTHLPFTLHST